MIPSFSTRPDGVVDLDLGPEWKSMSEALLDAVASRAPRGSDGRNPSTYWIDRCLSALLASGADSSEVRLLNGNITELWRVGDLVVARSVVNHFDDQAMPRLDFVAVLEAWIDAELDRWGQERGGSWAITRGDVLLGRVGIGGVSLEEGRAGITYWVLPEARGRGVASRALVALADWGFDTVGFHRLELDHSTRNPASCRVAEKAGFAPEGTVRGRAMHFDGWHDMHMHGLLADDPRPGKSHA